MKDENKKYYNKALNLYNKGQIDKALAMCEKGIASNLKNSNILNLKGLLLYLKGELNEAIASWKVNKDYNNDEISKTYLSDAYRDYDRQELYKEAEYLLNNLYIDDAIEKLLICSESDFNLINVNNLLAICYFRKGQYENSRVCLDKVLFIDKNNAIAKNTYKEINDILEIKDSKKVIISAISLILVIAVVSIIYKSGLISKIRNNENHIVESENNKENQENNNEVIGNLTEQKEEEEIEQNIEKPEVAEEIILTKEEIQSNYEKASGYYEDENYSDAKVLLEKTLVSAKGSHLYDDILFFLASSYDRLNDKENAIKYFNNYLSQYDRGNYSQEAYYRMALIYKDIDIEKGKEYARDLITKYPDTIYYNDNIKEILNN